MKQPVGAARELMQSAVDQTRAGRAVPEVDQLLKAILEFERIEFDVPLTADSDGFLFQYGKVNWFAEPTFSVCVARQLEIAAPSGEHEAFVQIQAEYRYAIDADLDTVPNHNAWRFSADTVPFSQWLELVRRDQIWSRLEGKFATGFEISQDIV